MEGYTMKNDYRNEFPLSPLLKEQESQMDEKEYYREKIIEMVTECDDLHWLKVIYTYLNSLL
jgi:hypothetical protein